MWFGNLGAWLQDCALGFRGSSFEGSHWPNIGLE